MKHWMNWRRINVKGFHQLELASDVISEIPFSIKTSESEMMFASMGGITWKIKTIRFIVSKME
jgi:hypothetical protein